MADAIERTLGKESKLNVSSNVSHEVSSFDNDVCPDVSSSDIDVSPDVCSSDNNVSPGDTVLDLLDRFFSDLLSDTPIDMRLKVYLTEVFSKNFQCIFLVISECSYELVSAHCKDSKDLSSFGDKLAFIKVALELVKKSAESFSFFLDLSKRLPAPAAIKERSDSRPPPK